MAHLGFSRTVYESGGTAAVERLAYISRTEGQALTAAERQLCYLAADREDLVETGARNLPAWAGGDPQVYFQAAEQYEGGGEKRRYTAFEEWKVTLPQEFSLAQNRVLMHDLLEAIAGKELPATYAFHNPKTMDGTQDQPHMHVLISARINDQHIRSPQQHFQRWNSADPARGGAQKHRAFSAQGAVKHHRVLISDMLNLHLERHGCVSRVHPDSLRARNIGRAPEPKLRPKESQALREDSRVIGWMQRVLDSRATRATQPPREQNNARQYWEQRKVVLGITRDMAPDRQVAQVLLARHGRIERVPARYRPLVEPPSPMLQRTRSRGLAQQFDRLARQLGHDDGAAHGTLHIHLHDRERDQGLSW